MATAEVPRLSVVIPVLDDAVALGRLLGELEPARHADLEVLVVDGGSRDEPGTVVAGTGARLLETPAGRGLQLAAGVEAARGAWLWFLHADSSGIGPALAYLRSLPADAAPRQAGWGRFDVVFEPSSPGLSLVAWTMRLRSRLTGICTGDQGIFVHRALLARAGGMPAQPLMEDIELSRRLRRLARPRTRREPLTTSSRRWRQRGVLRTVLGMWWFRLRYWLGADPERLAREYYP